MKEILIKQMFDGTEEIYQKRKKKYTQKRKRKTVHIDVIIFIIDVQ